MTQELTDVLSISGANLQQVAVIARDVMQLEHLRALRQRVGDAAVSRGLLGSDRHKSQHRLIEGVGIDEGGIPTDDAARFELANALKDSGRSQPNNSGNVRL